jgi:hypothetical protein
VEWSQIVKGERDVIGGSEVGKGDDVRHKVEAYVG